MTFTHAYQVCLFGGLGLGLILTPLMIRLATVWGLVDLPGARKVHRLPIPRIGGIAIALATLVPFAIVMLQHADLQAGHSQTGPLLTLIAAAFSVMLAGLIDDLANIHARWKLLVLMLASGMFCASGGVIDVFQFQGKTILEYGPILAWSLTILFMVSVTVSINFIDGLDGLAAGIVAIAALVLAFCCYGERDNALAVLCLSLFGALMGFLVFNFNPARIFMGDCGSMFIGFLMAGLCVTGNRWLGTTRAIILPSMVLCIPLLDTSLTLVRRAIVDRRSMFSAERGHIHHRLLDVGLKHRQVVLVLYTVTLLAAATAMVALLGNFWATAVTASGFCFGLFAMVRVAGSVRARETLGAIKRNRALGREHGRYRKAFEELQLEFRNVRTFDDWWKHVCRTAELLDFSKLDLPVSRRDGSSAVLRWRRDGEEIADANAVTAEIPIPQRRSQNTLRADVEVRVTEFLESAGQRLSLFSRLMGECGICSLPEGDRDMRNTSGVLDAIELPNPQLADTGPHNLTATDGPFAGLRVAIVHDFLYTYAGAERVLEQLVTMFPEADLFSLFDFLPEEQRGFIRNKQVTPTFIQKMPFARSKHRMYLPLMPLAIEQLDVSAYDIVISSSYVVAKGVLTRPDQLHICYCHTPVRFAWDLQNQYLRKRPGWFRKYRDIPARTLLHYIRHWDIQSANNVDCYVTNSDFVARRIEKVYRRHATPIYPPVDTDWFALQTVKEDYYLTASRLVTYKRIDLIVEAFNHMPSRRLLVIGEGPELAKITAMAGPNVRMLGYQQAARLREYMQRARGFIFAAEEDFGIVPVEAQSCGTPVIAFGRGGVTETVIPGKTGILFNKQTVASLVDAVNRFEKQDWDPKVVRNNAERFSIRKFREDFLQIARKQWASFLARRTGRTSLHALTSQDIEFDRFEAIDESQPEGPR